MIYIEEQSPITWNTVESAASKSTVTFLYTKVALAAVANEHNIISEIPNQVFWGFKMPIKENSTALVLYAFTTFSVDSKFGHIFFKWYNQFLNSGKIEWISFSFPEMEEETLYIPEMEINSIAWL